MAACLAVAPTAASARLTLGARASVSSGSRAPSSHANVSPTQLLSRLDAIRQKAKTAEVPCAVSAPSTERLQDASAPFPSPASSGNATHFGDCRSRLQDWWKEHLEDKAALVQAACGEVAAEEQEESLIPPPVEVAPSYPVNVFGSRH